MSTIYAVGFLSAYPNTKRIYQLPDSASGSNWSFVHSIVVNSAVADSQGNLYIGGTVVSSATTKKYNGAGTEQWSRNHGATVNSVVVDSNDNIITGGAVSSFVTTRKYNNAGKEQWTVNHGGTVLSVAVDSSDNIYTAGVLISGANIRKYNSSGKLVWSRNYHTGETINHIEIDSSENIYLSGDISATDGYSSRKYNSSGTLLWSGNYDEFLFTSAIDSSGNFYTSVYSASNEVDIKKYDSSGSEITTGWPIHHNSYIYDLFINESDDVYAGGAIDSVNGFNLRKYQSDGTLVWERDVGALKILCVTTFPPVSLSVSPPGMIIPISLAVPYRLFGYAAPALLIPLRGGAPSVTDPPIPAFGDDQKIYHCFLTGFSSLMELPLISIQCQKRQNDSTWLVAVIDGSEAILGILPAAILGGSQVVIYAGTRNSAGIETIGEFLRATLIDFDAAQAPGAFSISLRCRVAAQIETLQTRLMTGISQRQEEDGRRKIRCDVNPVLRPGDTVDTGSETWIAYNIRYFISANAAYMDVQEPPNG